MIFRVNLNLLSIESKEKDRDNISQTANDFYNKVQTTVTAGNKNVCSTRVSTESNESNFENNSYNNVNNRKCKIFK